MTSSDVFGAFALNPILKIKYTKLYGSTRVVRATINQNLIPFDKLPKGVKFAPDDQINVFDLENGAWRSLKYDGIQSFEAVA